MANIVQTEATNLLGASLGKTTFTAPTATTLALIITGTASTATTAGTEASGGSYARQPLTSALGTPAAGAVTNTAAVTFTNMPATAQTVGIEIWDTQGTPARRWYGALTAPKTTAAGDTLSFAASSINISLA